jgi:hypothetical protein
MCGAMPTTFGISQPREGDSSPSQPMTCTMQGLGYVTSSIGHSGRSASPTDAAATTKGSLEGVT